jgi:hypothetical protein
MVWRSLIIAGYSILALIVGIAYGGRGLLALFFFYFCAGAWVVFLLAWNWASREAGRWHGRRLAGTR